MKFLIRTADFIFSFFGLIVLSPIFLLIVIICFFDTRSPFFLQTRVGRHQKPFTLIKFRTMSPDTQSVASHLAPKNAITKVGGFLRKTKLDELPQLINVLTGSISLVGPRPCLPNQEELVQLRSSKNIFDIKPGITGLAQINNIDMSDPKVLVEYESKMIAEFSFFSYLKFIVLTALGKGSGDAAK